MRARAKTLVGVVAVTAFLLIIATVACVAWGSPRVRPFETAWWEHVGDPVPLDSKIEDMARRAQIDSYVTGLRPIGRRRLVLHSAFSSGPAGYDLVLIPTAVTHTIVIYHFSTDGKMQWKTCTWTEA